MILFVFITLWLLFALHLIHHWYALNTVMKIRNSGKTAIFPRRGINTSQFIAVYHQGVWSRMNSETVTPDEAPYIHYESQPAFTNMHGMVYTTVKVILMMLFMSLLTAMVYLSPFDAVSNITMINSVMFATISLINYHYGMYIREKDYGGNLLDEPLKESHDYVYVRHQDK